MKRDSEEEDDVSDAAHESKRKQAKAQGRRGSLMAMLARKRVVGEAPVEPMPPSDSPDGSGAASPHEAEPSPRLSARRGSVVTGRRGSVFSAVLRSSARSREQTRRESIAAAKRRTSMTFDEAEVAAAASEAARNRAFEAQRAASMAKAIATRQAWEERTLRFLADGNARLVDGTFVKIWVAVQQEIAEAETKGVPLSDQARAALLKMNTAEKAIKAASNAAKRAAEKAMAEFEKTKEGRRGKSRASASPPDERDAAAKAEDLARQASSLVTAALESQKKEDEAQEKLRLAREEERRVRWGGLPPSRNREEASSFPEAGGSSSSLMALICCGCLPARPRPVLPPASPSEVEFQGRQRVGANGDSPTHLRLPPPTESKAIDQKPLSTLPGSNGSGGSSPGADGKANTMSPRAPTRLPPLEKSLRGSP